MESLCIRCKGKGLCGKPCRILARFQENAPRVSTHFSGPSPPEIFVGRIGYPNVNVGVLAPTTYDTKHAELNDAEAWSANNLSIANVLRLRGQMVHGKAEARIKGKNRFRDVMHELALTHRAVSSEFFLKKQPTVGAFSPSAVFRPMTNPAPIDRVLLEENTVVYRKVDYLVNDVDVKATTAIKELTKKTSVDHLQKLLSAGLLGQKTARRMVPTRWSITAVDDTISKQMLEKIRYYQEIDEIIVLEGSYVGNYIKILILPGTFSFEAIEVWQGDSAYGMEHHTVFAQDYESFEGRKTYAKNITGGYYAMRLPVCELLEKIKRQGTVLVFREITHEYYAPLGVGVVREATRRAIKSKPRRFDRKEEAVNFLENNMVLAHNFLEQSWVLENYGKQKKLRDFFESC